MPVTRYSPAVLLFVLTLWTSFAFAQQPAEETPPKPGTTVMRAVLESTGKEDVSVDNVTAAVTELKDAEKTKVNAIEGGFELILFPKEKLDDLKEKDVKKAVKSLAVKLEKFEVRTYAAGGKLNPPRLDGKLLAKMSAEKFYVVGRSWVQKTTVTNENGEATVEFTRFTVAEVTKEGATVNMEYMDADWKVTDKDVTDVIFGEDLAIGGSKTSEKLETIFGKLDCTKHEATSEIDDDTKSVVEAWRAKPSGLNMRIEYRTESTAKRGKVTVLTSRLNEVIEISADEE